MNYRAIVAWEFRIGGLVLGLSALMMLISLGWSWWSLQTAPLAQPSQHLSVGKYGLVALLSYGAQGLGAMLGFLGTVASLAAALIGVLSVAALVIALLLYFTGRGIGKGENWARVFGIMFSVIALLCWFGMLFVLPHDFLAVAYLGVAVALSTLLALGWKFV